MKSSARGLLQTALTDPSAPTGAEGVLWQAKFSMKGGLITRETLKS